MKGTLRSILLGTTMIAAATALPNAARAFAVAPLKSYAESLLGPTSMLLVLVSAWTQEDQFSTYRRGLGESVAEFRWSSAEREFWRLCEHNDLAGLREQFTMLERRSGQIRADALAAGGEGSSSAQARSVSGRILMRLGVLRRWLPVCERQIRARIGDASESASAPAQPGAPPVPSPPDPQGLTVWDRDRLYRAEADQDADIVDEQLVGLEDVRVAGDCDRFQAEVARLRSLTLEADERNRLHMIVLRGCPPTAVGTAAGPSGSAGTSPPAAAPPDADDVDSIIDDPDAGLRSQGLAPQQRPPASAASPRAPDGPIGNMPQQPDANVLWGDYFYVAGHMGESDVPQTGIGVTRAGAPGVAPETDAGTTGDRVSTVGFEGALGFGEFRVHVGYSEGDASTSFDVQPISGGFNGAVFGALSPAGSSGIGASSVTLAGQTEVDLSRFRIGADLEVAQPAPATRIFLSFDYFRDVRTYSSSLTGATGGVQFSQERDQRVRDHAFGLGVGAETRIPFGSATDGGKGLSLRLDARVQAYLLDSDLRSIEHNISNFGPVSDRDFTIEIEESESDIGVAAAASGELDYALTRGFAIFAGGSVEYRSRVGGVFNPNSGDQVFFDGLTTGLTSNDFWSYGARIGIRVAFGRR
ncbi:MAG TPA: hypothetical protein VEC11_09135 [Allosphingosinicella sp.]|nr:hypothetical protein [Allosphingosinicella sp.]